jgi:oxaloacetate decarboxylase alpha subunit
MSRDYNLAGKTGTTDELRDSWFAGFSGDYLAVVWLGRDDKAKTDNLTLADDTIDDVLTYALFPQVGLDFIKNRNNPDAFEPVPTGLATVSAATSASSETYDVSVNGKVYQVEVGPSGSIENIAPTNVKERAPSTASAPTPAIEEGALCQNEPLLSPMAGNILRIGVACGDDVHEGDVVIILEAMKMETEVRAHLAGRISDVFVKEGESIPAGAPLILIC